MSAANEANQNQVSGSYSYHCQDHVAVRITFTIVMPKLNDALLVAYGRKHLENQAELKDAQVIAHLAALALAGLADGLSHNPEWLN